MLDARLCDIVSMLMTRRLHIWLAGLLLGSVLLSSCTGGPQPQPPAQPTNRDAGSEDRGAHCLDGGSDVDASCNEDVDGGT